MAARPALEVLAGSLDAGVLLEVDTYWAAVGGQDVPALLGRLGTGSATCTSKTARSPSKIR